MCKKSKINKTFCLAKKHFLMVTMIHFLFHANILFASNNDSLTNQYYQQAYGQISNMLNGKSTLRFEDAIFEIENAYHNNQLSKTEYTSTIDFHTKRIFQLAIANESRIKNVSVNTNPDGRESCSQKEIEERNQEVLLNWAIYTYLTDTTFWKQGNMYVAQYPMQYAKDDPYGNEKWENTMVTNLILTENENHSGNCFSLSALYYIFSMRLQSNACLSTAPQHIFIQHKGFDRNYYNVEIPTKSFPRAGSIKAYTYTTHEAVTNGIALKRLSEKEAVALCLVYLAKSYERKLRIMNEELRMKNFDLQCADLVLKYDSTNLNALLLKEQVLEEKIKNNLANKTNEVGYESENEITNLIGVVSKLHKYGYEPMPTTMQELLIAETLDTKHFEKSTKKTSPFQEIDTKQNYYTLSKNKFPELHETKNTYNIGMVSLNLETSTIAFDNTIELAVNNTDPVLFALSIDPLAEKFSSMSPYNAMNNDPVNMIDPDGKEFQFAQGTSNRFISQFYLALQYLRENGQADIVDKLDKSAEIITVSEVSGIENVSITYSYYSKPYKRVKNSGHIFWDPTCGLAIHDDQDVPSGEATSPATNLLHEMDHASQLIDNTKQFIEDKKSKTFDAMDNWEENRVINGREKDFASQTGEGVRNNHRGGVNYVNSPTENKVVDLLGDEISGNIYSNLQNQKERLALETKGAARKLHHEDWDIGTKPEGEIPSYNEE
jgi:hypothetical protein